jgi:hypothetical protein
MVPARNVEIHVHGPIMHAVQQDRRLFNALYLQRPRAAGLCKSAVERSHAKNIQLRWKSGEFRH